ncbi:MAG TPA: nitroreductase family protein [Candidatus Anaerobiospirillum pullistercoris]|uniref:Nitroreductase family protein n=1 Tax=Candidatus Anaerobiospirillum pullistercoris TaxID=2838452 RepID=A0A9D1WBW9_9GAMM|nr:nitroreductase family protein [Candidatus Anaerobiospirillum pullistercoris]
MTLVQKGADALTVLRSHESRRKFTGEKISPECMEAIHDAIMQTSSTCFFQFVTVITVQDQAKLKRIAELAGNQTHIAKCSHYLVFCLDLTKLMHFTELKPPFGLKFLIGGLNDCSMCCQNALVAAEAQGLGGVVVGGYKRGIAEVSQMLKLPQGVIPLLSLCLGVPDPEYEEEQKPRLPRHWIFMDEEFHDPYNADELKAYDAEMQRYYQNRRYNQGNDTWTQAATAMLPGTATAAQAIIDYLKAQGFEYF